MWCVFPPDHVRARPATAVSTTFMIPAFGMLWGALLRKNHRADAGWLRGDFGRNCPGNGRMEAGIQTGLS